MRLIKRILQMSLFAVMALIVGPAYPVNAGSENGTPSANNKRTAIQTGTAQSAQTLPAGHLKIPMYFEANHGQTDPSVKFFTRASGYNLYLTGSEAVTVLPRAEADKTKTPIVVRMKLTDANANPSVEGLEILPGRTSYFLGGDRSKWQVGVEQFAKVKLGKVYPGIDMVYRFNNGNVEYDFVVAPGANPGSILMGFEGSKGLRLDPKGNLVLSVEGGELTYKAPDMYQMTGAKRTSVKGRFVLAANNQASFKVGNYIKSKELVIDPAIMYGTFLGGTAEDKITAIKVDGARQAYVTGYSMSAPDGSGGFPATTPAGHTYPLAIGANNGSKDVFVAKLSEDGSKLLWLAWLGGSLDDQANGIALQKMPADAVGEPQVFITGETKSDNVGIATAFPVYGPAMQACYPNTGSLAFVAQLTQPGNIPNLVYSTCWGGVSGTLANAGNAIAVDSLGAAYVTGTTEVSGFTVVGGAAAPYNTIGGAQDGFVMKIKPAGTGGVEYSMFMGPTSGTTYNNAIAVDSLGKAWVAGKTTSDTWPAAAISGHFATARTAGGTDAFVAEVNATGTGLDYMTYINGDVDEEATAIALNKNGVSPYNVFVAGWTVSDTDFPSTAYLLLPTVGPGSRPVPYQQTLKGADDAFILRLNPAASGVQEMVYATHVGSDDGADRAYSLALDSRDDAYISGWTEGAAGWHTTDTDPPLDPLTVGTAGLHVTGSVLTNTSGVGVKDAFVAAISPDGLTRPFFTFLGSADAAPVPQAATGIAIDALHNIYVSGFTGAANFPTTTASLEDGTAGHGINRNSGAGALDGFVLKIAPVVSFGAPLVSSSPTITIDQPADSAFFAYTSTTAVITYADNSGSGLSTGTLVIELDNVALDTSTFTLYASSATVQLTGLSQSTHTLSASIADNLSDVAATTNTFTVDLASPTIAIAQPVNGGFLNQTSTTVVVNYGDTGGSGISTGTLVIKLDNVVLDTSTYTRYVSSATVQLIGLSQAAHTLDASIEDYVGNLSTAAQTGFTVDLTSPTIAIVQPADGSIFNYTSTTVVVNYGDSGGSGLSTGTLVIKLDNVALSTSTYTRYVSSATILLTGLSQAAHTLDASIEDYAGNLSTAAQTGFTVDLSSPTIAIVQPANGSFLNYTSTTVVVNYGDAGGSGLSSTTLVIELDNVALGTSTYTRYVSSATVQLPGLSQAAHTLDASIMDNSGNLTNAVQTGFTVDLASPTISIVRPLNGSFVNSPSTMVVVNYGDTGGSGLSTGTLVIKFDGTPVASGVAIYASSATVLLTGLTQAAHTLDASIKDNAGNLTNAAQAGFTVALTSPTIAIAQPLNGSFFSYASTTVVINYGDSSGSGLSTGTLVIKFDGTPVASGLAIYASSATVLLTGLTQAAHTLDASIKDNAGNLTNAAPTGFTVDLASPTIAIAQPLTSSIFNYTSTMVVVSYGDTGGSGLSTGTLVIKFDGTPVASGVAIYASSATVLLTGLTQAAHTLDASIKDNAGNLTNAAQTSFTVALTPPGITIARPLNGSFFSYTSTMVVINYVDVGGSGLSTGTLVIKLDNVALPTGTFTRYVSSATVLLTLTQAHHTLDASIKDNAGNLANAVQTGFTVSLTPPTIAIAPPLNGSYLNSISTTAIINYADMGGSGLSTSTLVVKLDGVTLNSGVTVYASSAAAGLIGLTAGAHTVNASISDNLGHVTAASQVSFTVYASAACGEDFFFPSPATGPTGTFAYCMAAPGTVKIRIYNVIGDMVAKIEDGKAAGPQLSALNTHRLAPGVYLYRLQKNYGGGNSTTSKVKKFVVKH